MISSIPFSWENRDFENKKKDEKIKNLDLNIIIELNKKSLILKIIPEIQILNLLGFYKSKTEVLLPYKRSFIFNQKARIKYIIKPPKTVAKDAYMKNNRTDFTFIPKKSANREHTAKPYFSSKILKWYVI